MTSSTSRRDPGIGRVANRTGQGLARALNRVTAQAWEPIAFSLSMSGPLPDRLRALPRDLRPGNPARGLDLIKGRFAFAGTMLDLPRQQPWKAAEAMPSAFREELHGFAWLRDLGALDRSRDAVSLTAREKARALFAGWLGVHMAFSEPAWRPDIVGRRIISWLTEALMLAEGSDLIWRTRLNHALGCQARYLFQTAEHAPAGRPRLTAHLALLLACLALGDAGPRRHRASARLIAEIEAQVRSDGGHQSREIATQLDIVADLLVLKDAFTQSNTPMPQVLADITERMAAFLELAHIGNGVLGFDGIATDPQTARAVIQASSTPAIEDAPHSGFYRLGAESTCVLVDAGLPVSGEDDGFAFELNSAGTRVLLRSALKLGDGPPPRRSELIEAERYDEAREPNGGIWLDLAHDFLAADQTHRVARRLFLHERGGDLRGEDTIARLTHQGPRLPDLRFVLRFVIAPGVIAEQEGRGVRLILPSGEHWRFQCRGGEAVIADASTRTAEGPHPVHQIVIEGTVGDDEVMLRWALKREARGIETSA